jgi:hypothetical protein
VNCRDKVISQMQTCTTLPTTEQEKDVGTELPASWRQAHINWLDIDSGHRGVRHISQRSEVMQIDLLP